MKKLNLVNAIVLALTLAISVGCASKKKQEDAAGAGGDITSSPIGFDSMGSDSGKIEGLSTVFFEYDRSSLTRESIAVLRQNSEWMKANAAVNVQIEGHCDARGSIEYNLALGERRARAVRDQLVKLGVPAARLSIVSYGKERPLVFGESEDAFAKNRRANFVPLR